MKKSKEPYAYFSAAEKFKNGDDGVHKRVTSGMSPHACGGNWILGGEGTCCSERWVLVTCKKCLAEKGPTR